MSKCVDIDFARQLERELNEAKELHIMQLAAISTQAVSNTDASVDEPLKCHSDFKTTALMDVNKAIHREIALRKELNEANKQCDSLRCMIQDGTNAMKERDQWREVADRIASSCNDLLNHGYVVQANPIVMIKALAAYEKLKGETK